MQNADGAVAAGAAQGWGRGHAWVPGPWPIPSWPSRALPPPPLGLLIEGIQSPALSLCASCRSPHLTFILWVRKPR